MPLQLLKAKSEANQAVADHLGVSEGQEPRQKVAPLTAVGRSSTSAWLIARMRELPTTNAHCIRRPMGSS